MPALLLIKVPGVIERMWVEREPLSARDHLCMWPWKSLWMQQQQKNEATEMIIMGSHDVQMPDCSSPQSMWIFQQRFQSRVI